MKPTLIIILSIALAGCTWINDPGDSGKQYQHTLTEVYYFDIESDSLHILFGHNSFYPNEDPPVEIKNSHVTDRIMIVAEIKGRSGGKDPYVYKYIKFTDEHTLQFYISGIFIENPEKRISTGDGIAAIKTTPALPRYYFTHISIHKPETVQVSYNFINLPP